jgi:hypothetical protein
MKRREPATPGEMLGIGLLAVGVGLYFSLVGLGMLPIPGGPRNLHGPLWIVLCCGLAFALGGCAILLQRAAKADPVTGEMPANAPHGVRIVQYLMGVAIFACFALVGSWIAFGPGERTFRGTVPTGPTIGRIAFGIGAIITWAATFGFAVSGFRKLRRSFEGSAATRPQHGSAEAARQRLIYALEHDPEKLAPVFGKDHAPPQT